MTCQEIRALIAQKEAELRALDRKMGQMWRRRTELIEEVERLKQQLQEAEGHEC